MGTNVVLVLRALGIGDLLVAVPALRGLRARFPSSDLVLACPEHLRPLVAAIGAVDEILPLGPEDIGASSGPRFADFDGPISCVVNLHGRGPGSHRWLEAFDAELRWGHAAPGWDGPDWFEDVHERERWVRMLAHFGVSADAEDFRLDSQSLGIPLPSPAAIVHVGASQASRLWPIERFAHVGAELAARGHEVVLTGSGAERERAEAVAALINAVRPGERARVRVAAGAQTLGEFCASIATAQVVVSADTGAAHLANAFGRPSVVIFGPASVRSWGPPEGPHIVLTHEGLRRGDPFAPSPDPALLAVTSREAVDALDALGV